MRKTATRVGAAAEPEGAFAEGFEDSPPSSSSPKKPVK